MKVELEVQYADWLALFALGTKADEKVGELCGEMADCTFRIRWCSRGEAGSEEATGLPAPVPTTIILWAHVTPALTTLATPYEAIAQTAMELMLAQLEGQQTPRQIPLEVPLIVRESCGADRPR